MRRPGGRIVMRNWIPHDPTLLAQILKISTAYSPPPGGFVSPMTWGIESNVIERFAATGVPKEKRLIPQGLRRAQANYLNVKGSLVATIVVVVA